MKTLKLSFLLLFFLIMVSPSFVSAQDTGKPLYPILFVHGFAGDETDWTDPQGNWKIFFEGFGWQDGGIIHTCLENQKLSLHDQAINDISIKNILPLPVSGDFYFLNFHINFNEDPHPGNRFKVDGTSGNPTLFHITEGNINHIHIDDILAYAESPYTEFMKVVSVDPINNDLIVIRGWGPSPQNNTSNDFYIRDHSNLSNQASAVKQGIGVKLAIQKIKELNPGVSKVILICHSMGGLAAREYIQSSSYQNDVSLLLTIDSPHLGSNMSDIGYFTPNWLDQFLNYDIRSDAVRDLRYSINFSLGVPPSPSDDGIYLFGGNEIPNNWPNDLHFYSNDINGDGEINSSPITGLHSKPWPTFPVILHSIVSKRCNINAIGCQNVFCNNDDDVVRCDRQIPSGVSIPSGYFESIENSFNPVQCFPFDNVHTRAHQDISFIMRGLDEPDNRNTAYEISGSFINGSYMHGFTTTQPDGGETDIDFYKFTANTTGNAILDFYNIVNTDSWQVSLYDNLSGPPLQTITNSQNPLGIGQLFFPILNGQTYYISFTSQALSDSYDHPYSFKIGTSQTLFNGSVTPSQGSTTTSFSFSVTFQHFSNQAPQYVKAISEGWTLDLTTSGSNYFTGVLFSGNKQFSTSGNFDFYFEAKTAENQIVRFPSSGVIPLIVSDPMDKILTLTVMMEGLYSGSGMMHPAQDANGDHWGPDIADKVTVELHDATDYPNIVYSASNMNLLTNGTATVVIPSAYNGSYFITIKNRNHILISSTYPISFNSSLINYTFNSPTKAYGRNLGVMIDGVSVAYTGDVNQDLLIDGSDMNNIGNKNDLFETGYLVEDANGDGLVDGSDMNMTGNNNDHFIRALIPEMSIDGQPCSGMPILTDSRDGKTYTTVWIGNQCWMAQNLNVGNMLNGPPHQTNNSIIEKFCHSNLESNCNVYGGLYEWAEMVQYLNGATYENSWNPVPSGNVQGICPSGWHIPTDNEWTLLTNFLGGSSIAGGKLKETGTTHWASPNLASNSSGFSALPGGGRDGQGLYFNPLSFVGNFWSSSEANSSYGWVWDVRNYNEIADRDDSPKVSGYSVRCVKDCNSSPPSPSEGTHMPSPTQIIWNWNSMPGATGYKWSLTNNYNTAIDMGTATTKTETGLSCNTAYTRYAWAYNSCGYSLALTLNQTTSMCPFSCGQTFTDSRDGKTYSTVQIGTQCWMAQNLNLGMNVLGTADQANDGTIEKYCYDDDENNCNTYGGLYQWNEAMQYSTTPGVKGICPTSWHIPTDGEWETLNQFLGEGDLSGGKMKSTGTIQAGTGLWNVPNTGASNSSGFTGLPGGFRYIGSDFYNLANSANFWSSSQYGGSLAWSRRLYFNNEGLGWFSDYNKNNGLSIRCIKD